MPIVEESLRPVASFASLGLLLAVGHGLRARIRLLRLLSLPASCVGGIVGCVAHQLLLIHPATGKFVDEELLGGWLELPSLLTNVVFVTLVLGAPLPSAQEVWRLSGPQLAFGQLLSWGQYAANALLVAVWLQHQYTLNEMFAAVVPLGFEGGHGVVAGNRPTFERFGYPQGYDLGMVASTIGLLAGTLIGCGLANWAAWRGYLAHHHVASTEVRAAGASGGLARVSEGEALELEIDDTDLQTDAAEVNFEAFPTPRTPRSSDDTKESVAEWHARRKRKAEVNAELRRRTTTGGNEGTADTADSPVDTYDSAFDGVYPEGQRPSSGVQVVAASSLDSLAHHLSLVGVVMAVGWCVKVGIRAVVQSSRLEVIRAIGNVLDSLPLFLWALFTAVAFQAVFDHSRRLRQLWPVDRTTSVSICATAMDFLIAAAITTMQLEEMVQAAMPFLLSCAMGIIWTVVAFALFARLLPDYWAERAICEVGLSLGATATALLVIRMMDPDSKTPVLTSFCYKQLVHVMIVGGGVFTSTSIPLAHATGPWGLFGVAATGVLFWLGVLLYFHWQRRRGTVRAWNGGAATADGLHQSLLK